MLTKVNLNGEWLALTTGRRTSERREDEKWVRTKRNEGQHERSQGRVYKKRGVFVERERRADIKEKTL